MMKMTKTFKPKNLDKDVLADCPHMQHILKLCSFENEKINHEDLIDKFMAYIDETALTYSEDAFEYLTDNDITDFTDAIENGCNTVNAIANFYYSETVEDEFNDELKQLNLIGTGEIAEQGR